MAAAATDKFKKVARSTATTLSAPGYTIGNTSINIGSTSNWPSDTGVTFAIDQVNSSGVRIDGTYNIFKGVVSSGTQISSVSYVGGDANQDYPAGATTRVYIDVDYSRHNEMIDGILVAHNQDGTHATNMSLTTNAATLTSPKVITGINDTNNNELFKVTATGSAVNEFRVANAATGNSPVLSGTGEDTNISLKLKAKGTGRVELDDAGAPDEAVVATSETTAVQSYGDNLSTAGPSVTVTIGTSGKALVTIYSYLLNNGANGVNFVGIDVSGASTISADDTRAIAFQAYANNAFGRQGVTFLYEGLASGSTTFKMQYKVSANTGTFADRRVGVVPLH